MKRKCFLVALSLSVIVFGGSLVFAEGAEAETFKIGVLTDLHYRTGVYDDRLVMLSNIADALTTEGADATYMLGDIINRSTDRAESQSQINIIAAELAGQTAYWGVGNHDLLGTTLENFLVDAAALVPGDNFMQEFGNWRIIFIDDISDPYQTASDEPDASIHVARAEALTFLQNELDAARLAGKYILIMSHQGFAQNYPGTPAHWTSEDNLVYGAGVATPSATSGTGVHITTNADAFAADDVGKRIAVEHSGAWGLALITGYNNARDVTVTVEQNFADTTAATSWVWLYGNSGGSRYAYNSNVIRGIVDSAKAAGADIKGVLYGHGHANIFETVNGIDYYELPAVMGKEGANTIENFALLTLEENGTLRIAGSSGCDSYNWPYYFADGVNGSSAVQADGVRFNAGRLRTNAKRTLTKIGNHDN